MRPDGMFSTHEQFTVREDMRFFWRNGSHLAATPGSGGGVYQIGDV